MVVTERPLEALVLTGTDAVTRDDEVLDSQELSHVFLQGCRTTVLRPSGPEKVIAVSVTGRKSGCPVF